MRALIHLAVALAILCTSMPPAALQAAPIQPAEKSARQVVATEWPEIGHGVAESDSLTPVARALDRAKGVLSQMSVAFKSALNTSGPSEVAVASAPRALSSRLIIAPLLAHSSESPRKMGIRRLQGTEVCGTISEDTTWTLANSPYVVTCDVTVAEDTTLSVEAGVVVKFGPPEDPGHVGCRSQGMCLLVNGVLDVQGTVSQPVYFTSIKDDTVGGDTDGDGGEPAAGDWGYIKLSNSANVLHHAVIRYGGRHERYAYQCFYENYMLWVDGVSPTISDSIFSEAYGVAIVATGSPNNPARPTISNNTFTSTKNQFPLGQNNYAFPTYSGNDISGMQYQGIAVWGALNPDSARTETWPDFGMPYVIGPDGRYSPRDLTIGSNMTLAIQAGVVVKFGPPEDPGHVGCRSQGMRLLVNGVLDVQGTASQPVYFTSIKDDTVGGDTDGDGGEPAAGDWGYIKLSNSANVLHHAVIRYGGRHERYAYQCFYENYMLWVDGVSPTISDSIFSEAYGVAIVATGSPNNPARPTISNNTFTSTKNQFPLGQNNYAFPTYSGNDISGMQYQGIAVWGALNPDSARTETWPDFGMPYVIGPDGRYSPRDLTIGSNMTLAIQAGVVVKFGPPEDPGHVGCRSQGMRLLVNGVLDVQGTASQPVYFTSIKDDTVGGDTDGDGGEPAAGDWGYIKLSNSANVLHHAVIRYGGRHERYAYQCFYENYMLWVDNASPTIEYNTIAYAHDRAIYVSGNTHPLIIHNNILDNANYGLYNADPSSTINAENNWWGDQSGPYHPTTNPSGTGDAVSDGVDYEPWSTVPVIPEEYDVSHSGSPSSDETETVAEPVNVVFGNYTYQHTDLSIPGRGLPFAFQRTYNSAHPQDGPLGYGWTHSYNLSLAAETADTLLVRNEDGRQDRFTDNGDGSYTPPAGIFNTLVKNPDDTLALTHKDQTTYHFNATGQLTHISDKNGNTVSLGYTGGNLTVITDTVGRTVTLSYDAHNRITQITDPAGRTVSYGYDAAGHLTSITDARGQTTTFTYDSQHRLNSITDAKGHTFVQNSYDGLGRVVQQRDALNHLTTFSYDTSLRQTTVTDPLGHQTVYHYDTSWRSTGETDGLGYTVSYAYDANNNRTSVTDKNGHTTRYGYDDRGNTTVITDGLGYVTTITYDGRNNLTSRTDPLGHATAYEYDAAGNLITTTNPLSDATLFSHDGFGQMLSTTDANENITRFGYDAYGNQTVITDGLGYSTVITYDIAGRKLAETDALARTTQYGYDAANHLTVITDALGYTTRYTYDPVGNRTSLTDQASRITTYGYDAKDRLVVITDTMGYTTTTTYDANDNRTSQTDTLGHTTVYTYNGVNLMVEMRNPLGQVSAYGYDAVGNRTVVTDALGYATTFAYDALNRLTQVTDPLSHSTLYTYDAVGNKIAVTDANGNITHYGYDALNRLVSVTDPLGGIVTFTYDAVGNKTAMTETNGHTTTYGYDGLNRLVSVTDPLAHTTTYSYDPVGNKSSQLDPKGQTITYSYDGLNRLTQIVYPEATVQYGYDALGNRMAMTDTTGSTAYTYDALNRLTGVTAPDGRTLGYGYDGVGQRTSLTYPDGKVMSYAFDDAGQPSQVTDWAGRVVTYAYDAAGRLTGVAYPNGTNTTYAYDGAGRLIELANSGPDDLISRFTYTLDNVGNRLSVIEEEKASSTTTLDISLVPGWNLIAIPLIQADMTVTTVLSTIEGSYDQVYGYDASDAGDPWKQYLPGGDPGANDLVNVDERMGLWIHVTASDTLTISGTVPAATNSQLYAGWNLVGYPSTAARPVGEALSSLGDEYTEVHGYDASDGLDPWKKYERGAPPFVNELTQMERGWGYWIEATGGPTLSVVNATTVSRTITYTYDALYRLIEANYSDGDNFQYGYDPMGNRTAMTTTAGVVTYTYDAADRLLSAGDLTFTWDDNGNMLSKGDIGYSYDSGNRLTQVVSGTTTVAFVYDGDGQRVSKTVNGVSSGYLWDVAPTLPVVVVETTGSEDTLYTYGADLIVSTAPDGTQSYYHYDGLGSTRQLSDGTGQVVASYSYKPFGGLRTMTGASGNTFKFTGEQADDEIGLLYLRARYYDPEIGRFTTKDPFSGFSRRIQSLNRYVYVQNNPVNLVDPTGQTSKDTSELPEDVITILVDIVSGKAEEEPVLFGTRIAELALTAGWYQLRPHLPEKWQKVGDSVKDSAREAFGARRGAKWRKWLDTWAVLVMQSEGMLPEVTVPEPLLPLVGVMGTAWIVIHEAAAWGGSMVQGFPIIVFDPESVGWPFMPFPQGYGVQMGQAW